MARSCGIRLGPRRFELVVLDGSAKKHKIAAYMAEELPPEAETSIEIAAEVLREATRSLGVPRDNVGVAIDTGLAAFRSVTLPFEDKSKVEQVLKFEVEGQLPQWNIDDVVVDFLSLGEVDGENHLLTTAVRKMDVARAIDVCERAGFEPLEVELETTAMFNAAKAAELCGPDDAQVLVHIGDHATSLVVVDGGRVREMRAIHIGALTHRMPHAKEAKNEGEELGDTGIEEAAEPGDEEAPDPIEVQRRLDQAVKRIRREIGRSVSGARTQNAIDSIYVCGLELPGLVGEPILDVPVYVLDAFEEDSGQPADGYGPFVVPYGVAVRQLGGGELRPSLRREELRYTGTFEKLELPLAVVSLLLVTFLGVHLIFLMKDIRSVNDKIAYWRDSSNNLMIGSGGLPGKLRHPSDKLTNYVQLISPRKDGDSPAVYGDDPERSRYQQMTWIRSMLQREIDEMKEQLGRGTEIKQPLSALKGLTLVLDILATGGQQGGRPSLRRVQSQYEKGKRGNPDTVRVTLDITFFAENTVEATNHYEHFLQRVKEAPWYVSHDDKSTKSLDDGKGVFVQGLPIFVNTGAI